MKDDDHTDSARIRGALAKESNREIKFMLLEDLASQMECLLRQPKSRPSPKMILEVDVPH